MTPTPNETPIEIPTASLDLDALLDPDRAGVHNFLTVDSTGALSHRVRHELRKRAGDGEPDLLVEATCIPGLHAPYTPFREVAERLVRYLADREPAILRRHRQTLSSLLPHLRHLEPLKDVPPFRAWLIHYALRGNPLGIRDFYQGRDLSPTVRENLVHLVLETARWVRRTTGGSLILHLDGLEHADPGGLHVLQLLASNARDLPLTLFGFSSRKPETSSSSTWSYEHLTESGLFQELASRSATSTESDTQGSAPKDLPDPALEDDPFRRVYHAKRAGELTAEMASEAMQTAWIVSGYDSALHHAHALLEHEDAEISVSPPLLLGVLLYEADRYEEAHQRLTEAFKVATSDEERATVLRLRGYNGTFGRRNFEQGHADLAAAAEYYRQQGQERDVAWLLNSMAFSQLHMGNKKEAFALEAKALATAESLPTEDRFLFTILHLNLGRLSRSRSLDQALDLIDQAARDSQGDQGPHFLLLFYVTYANLFRSSGRPREALEYLARCVLIARDLDISGFPQRTYPLLGREFHKRIGTLDHGRLLRADHARIFLAFNLGRTLAALGETKPAGELRDWLTDKLRCFGHPDYVAPVREAFDEAAESAKDRETSPPETRESIDESSKFFREGVLTVRDADDEELTAEISQALSEGQWVGWLRHKAADRRLPQYESLFLFDPRSPSIRKTLYEELGRTDHAGSLLVLPEAAEWFENLDLDHRGLIQEANLQPDRRSDLPAVQPIRSRVDIVRPEDHRTVEPLLEAFRSRTGVPMIGAITLRTHGEPVAGDASMAVKYLLETTADRLVVGNRVIEKAHGPEASDNLLYLRPRLTGLLRPAARDGGEAADDEGYLVIRGRFIRVQGQGYDLLSECDGRRTVAELAEQLPEAQDVARIAGFLRDLKQNRGIHFAH